MHNRLEHFAHFVATRKSSDDKVLLIDVLTDQSRDRSLGSHTNARQCAVVRTPLVILSSSCGELSLRIHRGGVRLCWLSVYRM
jgi:hypothetical protein